MKKLLFKIALVLSAHPLMASEVLQERVLVKAGSLFVQVRATLATVSGCEPQRVPLIIVDALETTDQPNIYAIDRAANYKSEVFHSVISQLQAGLDEFTFSKVLRVLVPFTNDLPDPSAINCRALVPVYGDAMIPVKGMDGEEIIVNTPAGWESVEITQLIENLSI